MKRLFIALAALLLLAVPSRAQSVLGEWTDKFGVRGAANHENVLYAGVFGIATGHAELWRYNGKWTEVGSWPAYARIHSVLSVGDALYFSLGTTHVTGAGAIKKYKDGVFTDVGVSGVDPTFHFATALEWHDGKLYAGFSNEDDPDLARIYRLDGSTWIAVAGDGQNGSWNGNYNGIYSLMSHGGILYATTWGRDDHDGTVWKFESGTWSQIGGQGVGGSWNHSGVRSPVAIHPHDDKVYVGLQVNRTNGAIGHLWEYDPVMETWQEVTVPAAWDGYHLANAILSFRGDLFVGIGGPDPANAQLWRLEGGTWSMLPRPSGTPTQPANKWEWIYTLTPYNCGVMVGIAGYIGAAQIWHYPLD